MSKYVQSNTALNLVANSWQCEKGHHYDVAKQGYVNCMWSSINTVKPQDTPESVLARREFLQAGFYQPLQQVMVELLQQLKPKRFWILAVARLLYPCHAALDKHLCWCWYCQNRSAKGSKTQFTGSLGGGYRGQYCLYRIIQLMSVPAYLVPFLSRKLQGCCEMRVI